MTTFDYILLAIGLGMWVFYFGLECAINGGTSHGGFFKMIFMCLIQDICWLFNFVRINWARNHVNECSWGKERKYDIRVRLLDHIKYYLTSNYKYIDDEATGEEILQNRSLALRHANCMLPSKSYILGGFLFPFVPLAVYHYKVLFSCYVGLLQEIYTYGISRYLQYIFG